MENKPSKQDLIEANNLLEEAQDVFEKEKHQYQILNYNNV